MTCFYFVPLDEMLLSGHSNDANIYHPKGTNSVENAHPNVCNSFSSDVTGSSTLFEENLSSGNLDLSNTNISTEPVD